MKTLKPTTAQKSFCGKANVIETLGAIQLKSYNTIVCEIDKATGDFIRLWYKYSATTLKRINSFRETYGFPTITKKQWEAM